MAAADAGSAAAILYAFQDKKNKRKYGRRDKECRDEQFSVPMIQPLHKSGGHSADKIKEDICPIKSSSNDHP